jgi:hypothetical protein
MLKEFVYPKINKIPIDDMRYTMLHNMFRLTPITLTRFCSIDGTAIWVRFIRINHRMIVVDTYREAFNPSFEDNIFDINNRPMNVGILKPLTPDPIKTNDTNERWTYGQIETIGTIEDDRRFDEYINHRMKAMMTDTFDTYFQDRIMRSHYESLFKSITRPLDKPLLRHSRHNSKYRINKQFNIRKRYCGYR